MNRILISRRRVQDLAGITGNHLSTLVSRGRLDEHDALIDDKVRKGITLASLARYFGWSAATVDQILLSHRVSPDSDSWHHLTERNEEG